MSNKFISEFTEITTPLLSGYTIYDDGIVTYKMSLNTLSNIIGGKLINKTYSELVNHISDSTLIPGTYYNVTDFRTCYDVPDYYINGNSKENTEIDYIEGDVEPIVVFSTSVNTIDTNVYQPLYPNDKIKYDWTWSHTEITSGQTYGRITERIDELNNRTDYDHRSVYFKRYQSYDKGSQLTGFIESYNSQTGELVGNGTSFFNEVTIGEVLFFEYDGQMVGVKVYSASSETLVLVIVDPSFGSQINFSGQLLPFYHATSTDNYYDYKEVYVGQKIEEDYETFLTFNLSGNTLHNYIGDYSKFYIEGNLSNSGFLLANNVFFTNNSKIYSNTIGDRSFNNTAGYWFLRNTIAGRFYNNKIELHGFYSNTINEYFYNNMIKNEFYENIIGQEFYHNKIYSNFYENNIDNYFYNNHLYSPFYNNKLGLYCYDNNIYSYFYNNNISNNFNTNIISKIENLNSYAVFENVIQLNYQNNTILNNFQQNKIGSYLKGNLFYGEFSNNTVGNSMTSNQFFGSVYLNDIGDFTLFNDFFGSVNSNKWSNWLNGNSIGDNFTNNNIGNNFQLNIINRNFQSNIITNSNGGFVFNNQYNNSSVLCEDTTVNVYKNRSGYPRLSYYDEMDVLTTDTLTGDTLYSFTIQSSDFSNGYAIYQNTTPLGNNGVDGFTNTNSDNLYEGYYGTNLTGESLSELTQVYNNLGIDLNNSTGYVCQVRWGGGSSTSMGLVKFGAVVSNGSYFDIQTIDGKDNRWNEDGNGNGSSLTGTFLFPATFSFYLPLINKSNWC